MWRQRPNPVITAVVFLCVVLPIVIYAAHLLHEPELTRRAGASLSALGAALVIYQAIVESRIESRERLEHERVAQLAPANQEVARRIIANRTATRRHSRIQIVTAIAIIVCVGELLHGWGDYFAVPTAASGEARVEHSSSQNR